jgi:glycyl-tRNA synthetase alpha chain
VWIPPYDLPMGAATFHPQTFFRALDPDPWRAAFLQPCRRPQDGRYGENPNRTQLYYQFQVLLKPPPVNFQDLFLDSLTRLGIDLKTDDVRFVEDNWESPSLGAWGLGWEVWLNGMEIAQFTYFQQVGGRACLPVTGEITYGIERLTMYLNECDDMFALPWSRGEPLTYGDLYKRNEREMSRYNFEEADTNDLHQRFETHMKDAVRLLSPETRLPLPAYEELILASHVFNLLDARHALSVRSRQDHILRIRKLSQEIAGTYIHTRRERPRAQGEASCAPVQSDTEKPGKPPAAHQ